MKKRLTRVLVSLMSLALPLCANASNLLTVFDNGDELSNTSPINLVYMDEVGTRCQVIFPAEALAEMNGEVINSMTFYLTDEGITFTGGKVRVSVAETDRTTFPNQYITDGLVQVANITFVAGTQQLVINFDSPFLYLGGNLVLDTYVEEAAIESYSLFRGFRPENYSTRTRGEVYKFIPMTTFNYGVDDEYAAKVLPREVTFNTTRVNRQDIQTVTLKNVGTKPFTPAFQTVAPFGVTPPNIVLAAGESVEVPVTFNPQDVGDHNGMLNIDCGPAGTLNVPLYGHATQAARDLVVCDTVDVVDYASFVPIYGLDIDIINTEGQMIYPAHMLTEMVGHEILALRFHTYQNVEMDGGVIELSFKVVEDTAFTWTALVTDLQAVATVTPVFGGTDLVFDLLEPFEYNGGNLLVDCKVIEAGITNYHQTFFYGVPQEYNCSLYKSLWFGSTFDIEYVPFLPMATFSYASDEQSEILRGDVNLDGNVDINDVTALIDILLGGGEAPVQADCDLSDGVSIDDVTVLIDYLLAGTW